MAPSLTILTAQSSVVQHYIAQLRNVDVQGDRMRFRRNMERIGEIMAYELSKAFPYDPVQVTTPLGTAATQRMRHPIVLTTVLRAALPLYNGFLNVFEEAESAFIGAYRGPHQADHSFEVEMQYITAPDLNGKILILIDPMLATGKSILKVTRPCWPTKAAPGPHCSGHCQPSGSTVRDGTFAGVPHLGGSGRRNPEPPSFISCPASAMPVILPLVKRSRGASP